MAARSSPLHAFLAGALALPAVPAFAQTQTESSEPEAIPGEKLAPSDIGPARFVNLAELSAREATSRAEGLAVRRERNGAPGEWVIPAMQQARSAHSGEHHLMNKWGDTRMGIDFTESVDLSGAWVASQTNLSVTTSGLRVIGLRDGVEVARTEWFETLSGEPAWFEIDLKGIDRAVFEARAVIEGAGWFALDDLTFVRAGEETVLDFETLDFKDSLTGSGYGGLVWETGTGDFTQESVRSMPPPRGSNAPESVSPIPSTSGGASEQLGLTGGGTPPAHVFGFVGTRMFDPAATSIPPDTCGAVGPDHFVLLTNSNISVYEKDTGDRVVNTSLAAFFSIGGSGDPRVTFDPNSQRWFMLSTDFATRIYVAASMTSDPTGMWFSSFFTAPTGTDAGTFPDYPTLGVNQEGIYIGAAMFGGGVSMTMFAIDKAPLISATPSLGTITAFRGFAFDGALQPCVTYGAGPQYFISRRNATNLRVRRINPPLTAPTFSGLGSVPIPAGGEPPDAPALGSGTPLDSVGSRLMNAVFRNGAIWAAHAVNMGGRAGVRWYEVEPETQTLLQTGTVSDPVRSYVMPSISVNEAGDMLLGFSGSSPEEFGSAYVAGRRATDPPGETSPAQLMREGTGAYNRLDGAGRNRWGDYSLTSVDPEDESTFWTVQEYARGSNRWGNWIASFEFVDCGQVSNFCMSLPNSATAGAVMDWSGSTSVASNDFTLEVNDAPPGRPGLFFYGPNGANGGPFGDGARCVVAGGSTRLFPLSGADVTGSVSRLLDFASLPVSAGSGQILEGSTMHFQFWFRDLTGPGGNGFNLSDGLRVTFCP